MTTTHTNSELHSELAKLRQHIALERNQRWREMERHKRIVLETQWLRAELRDRDAERAQEEARGQDGSVAEICSPAVRTLRREEQPIRQNLLSRLLAALLLRFARRAARDRQYAQAEILYQAILLFRPRAFLWRQVGNMQAGQGLYDAAAENFRQAITADDKDGEAHLALGHALHQLHREAEAEAAFAKAISLDKRLLSRVIR
ncbi:tetratricopeptide repeat protein [Sphingomonas elodea]|uniref:tetratricopeptide repeat protein n=1 Tax=Sphingomonas elodea TaxID=179878 RepID=UPI000263100C|nr:tetratricopeptide repeat protein [Sphingomonas elodea]